MIRVTVDSIRVSLLTQQRMVMLRDTTSKRLLPIWIGAPEADAIASALQGHEPLRPMTHDLLKNVITELGGTVQWIAVTHLADGAYHARIVVDVRGGMRREIDSRSSDAIALAVRTDVPIYVDEIVFEQAGMVSEEESEAEAEVEEEPEAPTLPLPQQATSSETEEPEEREINEDSLSIFRDFINSLEQQKPPDESK